MRHGKLWAVLAVLLVTSCSPSKQLKDMVGYVPPTSFPAQPKRSLVADRPERVWTQLVRFLEGSAFEIEHVDERKNLLIARYSGDPRPYVDCGSIVTHENGALAQIAGSSPAVALNYELEEKPVVLNRSLNLDSRIIIRLVGQPQGTVVKTDTTYVVTKTIDVATPSGEVREGSRETVSFEAGGRGEFSKGTACQPNGSLDLAVLQSLPNIVAQTKSIAPNLIATESRRSTTYPPTMRRSPCYRSQNEQKCPPDQGIGLKIGPEHRRETSKKTTLPGPPHLRRTTTAMTGSYLNKACLRLLGQRPRRSSQNSNRL